MLNRITGWIYSALLLAAATLAGAQAPEPGLVEHWTLDGSIDGKTVQGKAATAAAFEAGVLGQALKCDGTQLVEFDLAQPLLAADGDCASVAYWLRNDEFPIPEGKSLLNQSALFATGGAKASSFNVRWAWKNAEEAKTIAPGKARISVWYWGAMEPKGRGFVGAKYNAKEWNHFAVVVDQKNAAQRTLTLYVNGGVVKQQVLLGALNPFKKLVFAAQPNKQRYTRGALDDVRLYSRALNAEEVGKLYQAAPQGTAVGKPAPAPKAGKKAAAGAPATAAEKAGTEATEE